MYTIIGNPLFTLAIITGLALIPARRVTAQTFTTLHDFTTMPTVFPYDNSDGATPRAGLVLSGTTLYGTTFWGGSSGWGTVFAVNSAGTGFTNLHNFAGSPGDGSNPYAELILSGNTLYGTTSAGGSSDNGTIFAINTDGTGYRNLHSFTAVVSPYYTNVDGSIPNAALNLSGNTLYGTASQGGSSGNGTVFALNTNGTGFTILHSFSTIDSNQNNTDGANPGARLLLSGNTLYGTASWGGNSGRGTVFKVDTNGTGFSTLHQFTAGTGSWPSVTNSDGANPFGGLILLGNMLYGTAYDGGNGSVGSVFKVNTDGTGFTNLHSFTPPDVNGVNADGILPSATLSLSGTILYGATLDGGSAGSGTLFALNTNGTGFTILYTFTKKAAPGGNASYTNSDGAGPWGQMLSGNTMYGAAGGGGTFGSGAVFSLTLPITLPQLAVSFSNSNLVLMWPTNTTGLTLQYTTNLGSPVWTTNSLAVGVVNGQNTVTNPITGSQRFFRLKLAQ
jgi:uncharacterized repeat protein (TIGR03803 family)